MKPFVRFCMAIALLAGCQEQQAATIPDPMSLTRESAGHYCQMTVLDHPGPKAQVHMAGYIYPLWFSQVRDAFAFDRMPEEIAEVTVIYVNDMGAAEARWDEPGAANWIRADSAIYVIGSDRRGGMGAPELVPFAERTAAAAFAGQHGGTVIGYGEIEDPMVLAPIDVEPRQPDTADSHDSGGTRG